jgi:hypothetical protein
MDYLEYKLWKAGVLVFLAFCWGLWRGFSGQSLVRGRPDSQTEQRQMDH